MCSSHSQFVYVLSFIIIIISSGSSDWIKPSNHIHRSFNHFCSNDLPCSRPLICSNSSLCLCPNSSTFWNTKRKTCLYCPSVSMEWHDEKCLSFIAANQGGITHQKARKSCLGQSAQLLQISSLQDFAQLQYQTTESKHARIFKEFFRYGAWVNLTDKETNAYDWCDMEYENEMLSRKTCIRLMRKSSTNDVAALCFDHADCQEKLPYICERLAETVHDRDEREKRAIDSQPQIQVIHAPAPATPPPSSSSENLLLYIAIFIVVSAIVVIICCCFIAAFLYIRKNNDNLFMDE